MTHITLTPGETPAAVFFYHNVNVTSNSPLRHQNVPLCHQCPSVTLRCSIMNHTTTVMSNVDCDDPVLRCGITVLSHDVRIHRRVLRTELWHPSQLSSLHQNVPLSHLNAALCLHNAPLCHHNALQGGCHSAPF